MKRIILLLLVVAVVLVSCSGGRFVDDIEPDQIKTTEDYRIIDLDGLPGDYVYVFNDGGNTCYVLVGYKAGGISCVTK